jgi:hypothetical protein
MVLAEDRPDDANPRRQSTLNPTVTDSNREYNRG